jgi:DNA-binding NtrC family response regulator
LNTVEIHLPPLRERREDVPTLSLYFLSKYTTRYRKKIEGFSPEALDKLLEYSWPGNVRELEHTLERAVIMCRSDRIQASNLGLHPPSQFQTPNLADKSLEEVEALLITKALARHSGNVSQAAAALGLSRGTLYRRMEKHGVYAPSFARKEK